MEIKKGTVVYSLAGHDKGDFQVIMEFDDKYAKVCDGKHRPIEKPKKKKLIHLKLINVILSKDKLQTNKSVRNALKPFKEASNKSREANKLQ